MIFTLTDRQYNVLDAYETEDYLIGSYIGSIIKTLDMDVLVNSANAEKWVEGNYVLCEDASGCRYWFTIYDAEDAHGDDQKKLTCYSGTIDIVSEDAIPIAMPATPQPFSWYFGKIFFDTGITIGINELEGMTRRLEFTSENASNAEMLQYVLNGFDNAEADLAVEFSGSVPTRVVLNVFRRLGNSEPQTILSDEDDSVTMLERTGSISGLATCLNPVGEGEDKEQPLTLIGKYYEERDENGELLYYSPTDHERVYSVKGRERFFVEIPGKTNGEFDGYINRRYQSQASTQDALWSESLAQLKKIDQPAVTYEARGHINCRLGDTIQIVSNEMKPPVMISAMVLEYKFNDDIPELNEYKFGNYAILESNIEDMSAMLAELKKSLVIVSSVEVLYALDNQGITPPTSGWFASYVSPEPGNWLWTKTVTYLSNNESSVAYSVSRVGEDGATGPTGPQGADGLTPVKGVDYFDGVDGQNGATGATGSTGPQGPTGPPTGIVEQSTAPTSPYVGMLWKDTDDGITRRWNGSAWTIFLFHADNISATNLAAIVANLGTITAGKLLSANNNMEIDLTTGDIVTRGVGSDISKLTDGTIYQLASLIAGAALYQGFSADANGTAILEKNITTGVTKKTVFGQGGNDLYVQMETGGILKLSGNLSVTGTAGNVYHTGKKPTPAEIGAATSGHTHTAASVGAEVATIVGASASGKYIKFDDGTMICYNRLVVNSLAITAGWGSWFISALLNYTFPTTFLDNPVVSVNVESTTGDIAIWAHQATTPTGFNGRFARGAAATFNSIVSWKAIGRWK